jgi:hypothetical protein
MYVNQTFLAPRSERLIAVSFALVLLPWSGSNSHLRSWKGIGGL